MTMRHRRANLAAQFPPCIICLRTYENTSARPFWMFDTTGRPVGTAHAGCASRYAHAYSLWYAPGELNTVAAQFHIWKHNVHPRPVRPNRGGNAAVWEAWSEAKDPNADPPATYRPTAEAYIALIDEFRRWQEHLDKGENMEEPHSE